MMTVMGVDRCRLARLHVACLSFSDLQSGHQMIWLHYFGQHGSGLNMLPHLQGEIDEHASDSRSHPKRFKLFFLQLCEGARLVYFGLLLRKLGINQLSC